MRTLAIGDIHGTSSALDALMTLVDPTPEDRLIFLGDYVDRGPDTRGVLDRLIALSQSYQCVFLRGNHELMMTRSRKDRNEMRMWLSVGGAQSLASYGKSPGQVGTIHDVLHSHWEFMENQLQDWHETDTHIFVHANLDPNLPLNEQTEAMLFWEFLFDPIKHISGKTVICGHSSQRSGVPLDLGDTICIDTNIYGGGWLTCLDVQSRKYWQADFLERTREGTL